MLPPARPKYRPYATVDLPGRTWPDRVIERAPDWCSVDLRDGNQALAIPMNIREKMEMFEMLVRIGFREIEVGFPSASQIEHDFTRLLIEEDRIPQGVYIQVLVQAREHLIRRTFESLRGAPRAVLHLYNSTSRLQREITFNRSRAEIVSIAVQGAQLARELAGELPGTDLLFQYSPESFSDTEPEFALEICEAVKAVWQPTAEKPMILNLPATVESAPPNVHADQIEWFCRHISERDCVRISLHTHNDRGCGAAATELGLMAGADRVEGTLFGNGERTGNLDIVTTALNLFAQGVDPGLDLSDVPGLREVYERCTRMTVPPRHPYAGDLVFTAFSGSHQDAIKKGFDARKQALADAREPEVPWRVPYLSIDPEDIGRSYEAIIRINSQSGKGGVAYLLERDYGLDLPRGLRVELGEIVNRHADTHGRELSVAEIYDLFLQHFVRLREPLELVDWTFAPIDSHHERVRCEADVVYEGKAHRITGEGNGPINALSQALEHAGWKHFHLVDYRQHAVGSGSASTAATYIRVKREDGAEFTGCGIDPNTQTANLMALVSAFNRAESANGT